MTDLLLICIVAAIAVIWTGIGIVKIVNTVDRYRPRQEDWVARHKRRIERNGFKSRMGAR